MEKEPLKKIGPYLLERVLGSGGMGTVYLGRHEVTDELVAVKILSAALAREEGFVERFAREIDAMRNLKNPHIVELRESGVDDEIYYYAMEYVDGETVTDRLKRDRRIPWEGVIHYAIQTCSALKAAHNAGIIHRDLKPSNLLITSDNDIKLTDFGVAQIFAANKLTATGGIIGTASYMSPEQAEGKRTTKQSDLYALGTVMYAMLTGRPPFIGRTTLDIIHKQRYGSFDRPRMIVPDIPHWLDEIVCKLMEKDPQQRYPDAYVLSLRLAEVLKKVELANQDVTKIVGSSRDGNSGIDETDSDTVSADFEMHGGPGSATLMRDLMQVELERERMQTPVARAFNNTWVLVLCLFLVIGGGFLWFPRDGDQESENKSTGNPRRLTADDKVWAVMRAPDDEIDRFLLLARQYREMGKFAEAEQTLVALRLVLMHAKNDQSATIELADKLIDDLRKNRAARLQGYQWLRSSISRIRDLVETNQLKNAEEICRGIKELYKDDPDAARLIDEAVQLINGKSVSKND